MEHQNDALEINLLDLFKHLKKRIWIILLAFVLFTLGGYINSAFLKTPQYTAHTQMYILNRANEGQVVYNDLVVSSYMLNDYVELTLGQNVTQAVIEKLELEDITPAGLAAKISVTAPENTRIMQISVNDANPLLAAEIANAVREEAAIQIKEIMEVDAVKLVFAAEVPKAPSSPNVLRDTILAAAIGIALSVFVISVIYLLDDTIRTEEDVEKRLGLNVLGVIPIVSSSDTAQKKTAPLRSAPASAVTNSEN